MKTYMTTAELAEHLSVSTAKVKEMMETGAIPDTAYFKHERTYRFHVKRVENHLLGYESLPEGVEVQTDMDFGE
ncbi:MAG TPA: helix-turn-helix domain-containing protein [Acidimicrobiia bacterium]